MSPVLPDATVADRYQLREVLGRGGMADVYRATDLVLDREVAVKVLRDSTDDESDRARFTGEARTLAQLSHSGLVVVLDAGFEAEQPYLVMELVEGPTLGSEVSAAPLDLERAGAVGVQVAEALAYVHAHGVVHRDVKPGNVLIGADGRVKLADFGIARLMDDAVRHTRTGHAIGTAAYLAPEQVTGDKITGRTDVYALGLVLLEALTGKRAYPGSPTEAALARLNRAPEIPVSLPPAWRDLITAATSLDPEDRPDAQEFAQRLRDQPTGPIPVARHDDDAGDTRLLTTPVATPGTSSGEAPAGDRGPAREPRGASLDRMGDALAQRPRAWWTRWRAADPDHRAVAVVALGLLLLILVIAIATSGAGDGGTELPANTPPGLESPMADLHEAVNGG
ncbi:MAG: serine/threonine-protein kinase [Nocardioides sp.]|nr:serine/threonine-protein kinase [Nocardioides sp.]